MFTGIIEETGKIINIVRGSLSCRITIGAKRIFDDLKLGDSVAVNGVCLTAAQMSGATFTADVMAETMRKTALGSLTPGNSVNLERAMPLNGRFGGHIVSGHIDGTGAIIGMRREDNAVWVRIAADRALIRYIVEKGSVALDGISLTVAEVTADSFSVSVIPHPAANTTLLNKKNGDRLNIECDIIGKYIEKLSKPSSGITIEFLTENGF